MSIIGNAACAGSSGSGGSAPAATAAPAERKYLLERVDDAGHLAVRDDVYGRDAKLLAALKGDDRRNADVPVAERREPSASTRRQASRMPLLPSSAPAPTSFFGGLFR